MAKWEMQSLYRERAPVLYENMLYPMIQRPNCRLKIEVFSQSVWPCGNNSLKASKTHGTATAKPETEQGTISSSVKT